MQSTNTEFKIKMKHIQVIILVIAFFISSSQTFRHKDLFDVKGKVALITGGLGGIGRAYAKELLKHGCKGISLVDNNSTKVPEVVEELEDQYGKGCVIFIKADVTDTVALEKSFDRTAKHFLQLDIIINNAAIADDKAQNGKLLLETDLVAVAVGTRLAFKKLAKCKIGLEGIIVNTAAIAGLVPDAVFPTYSAAASGIIALGRTFGHHYYYNKYNKIKILTLVVGYTNTPFFADVLAQGLPFEDELTTKFFYTKQQPEAVGKALITSLKNGKSGTVWSVNNSKLKKIDFLDVDEILTNQIFT